LQTFNAGPTADDPGVAYRPWPVLLAMCVVMVLAIKRRSDTLIVAAAISSLLYAMSAFLLAPELSLRMISPSSIVAMVCVGAYIAARMTRPAGMRTTASDSDDASQSAFSPGADE
jgi:hypothetical protein